MQERLRHFYAQALGGEVVSGSVRARGWLLIFEVITVRHRHVPEHEFRDMIARGDIVDGPTVAAYGLLLLDSSW